MESTWYHLGIDGGGTQCRARLYAPNGELIGHAKAGPANVCLGSERVVQSLKIDGAILIAKKLMPEN